MVTREKCKTFNTFNGAYNGATLNDIKRFYPISREQARSWVKDGIAPINKSNYKPGQIKINGKPLTKAAMNILNKKPAKVKNNLQPLPIVNGEIVQTKAGWIENNPLVSFSYGTCSKFRIVRLVAANEKYLVGIEVTDKNQYKKFLRDKIVYFELLEFNPSVLAASKVQYTPPPTSGKVETTQSVRFKSWYDM